MTTIAKLEFKNSIFGYFWSKIQNFVFGSNLLNGPKKIPKKCQPQPITLSTITRQRPESPLDLPLFRWSNFLKFWISEKAVQDGNRMNMMIHNCQHRKNTMLERKFLDAICDQVDNYFYDLFFYNQQ